MQRAWIPATMTQPDSKADITADTNIGQLYTIETGSDPYYPRGRVLAIGPDDNGDVFGDDDDSDDPDRTDELVDKNNMEKPLRDFTLCAALCSSATLQRETDDETNKGKWTAHGDPTEVALQVVSSQTTKRAIELSDEIWLSVFIQSWAWATTSHAQT